MNKINLKIILAVAIFFYSAKSFSQTTTTISYDATSSLSTTKCNVFDPPVNVGGQLHTSVIGAATFSTANGLTLPTNYTNSTMKTKRSDYRISYPFKSGYTYRIDVTAFGYASNSTAYPSLGAALFTAAGLTYTSTSCVAGDISGFPPLGSIIITQVNGTSTVYSPPSANFTSPSNYDYLVLEATCQAAQDISDLLYIQKIKIIETPPISFTLPSSKSLSCGSTTAQTFTVTNVYGTTGITNYTWNLGSASNGWLYNGNPAPQTIQTGTNNSISLTPVCGGAQSSVTATVTANGSTYNTNASTVAYTQPTMSIVGNSPMCASSSVYYVSGLPCNGTVTWSATPSGIVTTSTSNNQVTLSATGIGQIQLKATITSCGLQTIKYLTFDVGYPPAPTSIVPYGHNITNPLNFCPQYSYHLEAYYTSSSPQYEWLLPSGWSSSVSGGNNPFIVGSTGFDIPINLTSLNGSTDYVRVRAKNACGYSDPTFLTVGTNCGGPQGLSVYTISPNPATSSVKIDGGKNKAIKEVQIIDKLGTIKKTSKYSGKDKVINLDISSLPTDVYFIKIYDGQSWETKTLNVE
jgi:hypothetical protein